MTTGLGAHAEARGGVLSAGPEEAKLGDGLMYSVPYGHRHPQLGVQMGLNSTLPPVLLPKSLRKPRDGMLPVVCSRPPPPLSWVQTPELMQNVPRALLLPPSCAP